MLVIWHIDGPDSASFREHIFRVDDYLWIADNGMRMQVYLLSFKVPMRYSNLRSFSLSHSPSP